MTVAIVQSKQSPWAAPGAPFTENYSSPPTAGDTLVAFLYYRQARG